MHRNVNVSPKVSVTAKLLEQRTDSIINGDKLYITLSPEAIKVANGSLFYRTLACRPENEDRIRGVF